MSTSATAPAARPVNKWGVAIAVALGALLEVVDTSIVNVALNDMQNSLGATLSEVSWVVSSYAIANVIVLPMTAWLGHRFGKRRYFIFSLVGFTVASVLCGLSTTLPMLVVARVLQGLTGGGLLAKAQAYLYETFSVEEQPMAQAFFGAVVIAGPAIGPTLGGFLVTNVDWRWIFFINVPVAMIAVPLALTFLPRDAPDPHAKPVDWTSIALLAIGIGSLQTFLEEGYSEDWFESHMIVALAVTTVVGLVAFVYRQLKSKDPVVDLRVLRHRSLAAGSLLSIVIGMALYGALFSIPIFTQSMLHYTSEDTGFLLLPSALVAAAMMPVVGRLVRRFDPRIVLVCGALILAFAMHMLTGLTPQTGEGDLLTPLMIRAIGTTMMFLPLNLATLGPIPREDVGAASGLFNLTRQLGGSIGVALLSTLLGQRQAFHRAVLVEHIAPGAPDTVARLAGYAQAFVAKGIPLQEAQHKALALLDGMVQQQAAVMSFADTFWATGALILATLPLVLLLGKPRKGAAPVAAH